MRVRYIGLVMAAGVIAACNADQASEGREESRGPADFAGKRAVANQSANLDATSASAGAPVAAMAPPPPPSPEAGSAGGSEQLPTQSIAPSMMIRTGEARIKVESVDTAIVRLQELARRVGGYIANSSMNGGEKELRQATLELKIPAARFSDAESGLNAIGKVEYVTVNAQDVGEEFVDVTARVENSRRMEQRLITILATRTGKLEEVLQVERELARVRETIERYEGRLRYLRTRADVSTLSVTVHETQPLVGELGTNNRIVEAFKNAWRNFIVFLAWLIESLGVLLPVGLAAWLFGRWYWRRHPAPPKAAPPASED